MPTAPSTPEADALALLLSRYKACHNEYAASKRSLNWMHGGALVAGPVWILMLTAIYLDFLPLRPDPDDLHPVTYLTAIVLAFAGRLTYLWLRIRQGRHRLQEAKGDLDLVGYVVICDQTRHVFDPRLVLSDEPPAEGPRVVFEPYTPIDFAHYDHVFRLF